MLRQPYVLSIYPPGGPLDGNTTVAVRGRGLAAVRFVRFGDARGEVVRRGAALVVRSPPQWPKRGGAMKAAFRVSPDGVHWYGGDDAAGAFAYYAAVLTELAPFSGPAAGGVAVTLRGFGFGGYPWAAEHARCRFGPAAARVQVLI